MKKKKRERCEQPKPTDDDDDEEDNERDYGDHNNPGCGGGSRRENGREVRGVGGETREEIHE